ncbi:MAG TPA: LysR family transcriptional regulator, partial [Ilumatobacteraceae bacterium]|nr:LysR family transcriptional regulator [Ilumatobacteraceae bacterium]
MDDVLPNLSTAQLSYLVAITRHRTWAEAAASLGVTPSALSQGIAELERRLGVPLFAADGRRRVAHEHTATVAATAERVLADLDQTTRWLRSVGTGQVGRLRVGMIDIAAVHHCRDAVRKFRRAHPKLDVGFTVAPTGQLLERLERSELDVAICVDPDGVGSFDAVPLLRDDLAVYAPPGVAVDVPPAQWGPWLLFPADSRTRTAIDRRLRAIGAPLVVEMESHQPEVLVEMVRLGLGWTVLPTTQAEHGAHRLARAMAEPLFSRTVSAVTRRG